GMAIAANKVNGVRAAPAQYEEEVKLTREHNDAHILTLGARFVEPERASRMVDIFLDTEFLGGRHSRRLAKIAKMEMYAGMKGEGGSQRRNRNVCRGLWPRSTLRFTTPSSMKWYARMRSSN